MDRLRYGKAIERHVEGKDFFGVGRRLMTQADSHFRDDTQLSVGALVDRHEKRQRSTFHQIGGHGVETGSPQAIERGL